MTPTAMRWAGARGQTDIYESLSIDRSGQRLDSLIIPSLYAITRTIALWLSRGRGPGCFRPWHGYLCRSRPHRSDCADDHTLITRFAARACPPGTHCKRATHPLYVACLRLSISLLPSYWPRPSFPLVVSPPTLHPLRQASAHYCTPPKLLHRTSPLWLTILRIRPPLAGWSSVGIQYQAPCSRRWETSQLTYLMSHQLPPCSPLHFAPCLHSLHPQTSPIIALSQSKSYT